MPVIKVNEETLKMLKKYRKELSSRLGIKLSLGETIAWILKYGPRPEDYFPKPASELAKGE